MAMLDPRAHKTIRSECVDQCFSDDPIIWQDCSDHSYICVCGSVEQAYAFFKGHTNCLLACSESDQDEFISIVRDLSQQCTRYNFALLLYDTVPDDNPFRERMVDAVYPVTTKTSATASPRMPIPITSPTLTTTIATTGPPALSSSAPPASSSITSTHGTTQSPTSSQWILIPPNDPALTPSSTPSQPKQSTNLIPLLATIPATVLIILILAFLVRRYRKRRPPRTIHILPSPASYSPPHETQPTTKARASYAKHSSALNSNNRASTDYPAHEARRYDTSAHPLPSSPHPQPPAATHSHHRCEKARSVVAWLNAVPRCGVGKRSGEEITSELELEGVVGFPYNDGGGQEMRDIDAWDSYLRMLSKEEREKMRGRDYEDM